MRGKSAILDGPDGAFVVAEADVPDPDPNGLLVRQELRGICGTDAYVYRGGYPASPSPLCSAMRRSVSSSSLARTSTRTAPGGPWPRATASISNRACHAGSVFTVVHQQPTLC